MRVRLRSDIGNVVLRCWYEIPVNSRNAYIDDLVRQLHSDLDLVFPSSELGLEIDDFDLPRRSRIEGVIRDGDLISLKRLSSGQSLNQSTSISNQLWKNSGHSRTTKLSRPGAQRQTTDSISALEIDDSHDRAEAESHVSDHMSQVDEDQDEELAETAVLRRENSKLRDGLEKHDELVIDMTQQLLDSVSQVANLKGQLAQVTQEVVKLAHLAATPHVTPSEPAHAPSLPSTVGAALPTTDHQTQKTNSSSPTEVSPSDSSQSESSASSSSSDSTSSDTNDDESDSSSSASSSSVEEISSKIPQINDVPRKASVSQSLQRNGIPFQGKTATITRNSRRKRRRTLQRLIDAGKLPADSNFRVLEQFQEAYENDDDSIVAGLQLQAQESSRPVSAWDYPDEPEPGWETRLVVKEVECERNQEQRIVPAQQYQEEVERGRKRKRVEHRSSQIIRKQIIPPGEEDVILHADMYGDAAVITNGVAPIVPANGGLEPSEALEDGELEEGDEMSPLRTTPKTNGHAVPNLSLEDDSSFPPLPRDTENLPSLSPSAVASLRSGSVIAFKCMEMKNYAPSFSKYKTARVLAVDRGQMMLTLAPRDRDEPVFDYDGDRVPGPFDVVDEAGEIIEGRMEILCEDLMEPLLISRT